MHVKDLTRLEVAAMGDAVLRAITHAMPASEVAKLPPYTRERIDQIRAAEDKQV